MAVPMFLMATVMFLTRRHAMLMFLITDHPPYEAHPMRRNPGISAYVSAAVLPWMESASELMFRVQALAC